MLLLLLSFYINYVLINCDINATNTPETQSPSPLRNDPKMVHLPGQPIGAQRSLYIGPNHFRLLSTQKDQNFYAGRFGSFALNPGRVAFDEHEAPFWGVQNEWGSYSFTTPTATKVTAPLFPQDPGPSSERPLPTYNEGSLFHNETGIRDFWPVPPEWTTKNTGGFRPPYATTKDGQWPKPTSVWPKPYPTTKEGAWPKPTGFWTKPHPTTKESTWPKPTGFWTKPHPTTKESTWPKPTGTWTKPHPTTKESAWPKPTGIWTKPHPTTKESSWSKPTGIFPKPYPSTKYVHPPPRPTAFSTGDDGLGNSAPRSTTPPKQRYLDLMGELKEGYLVVFVLEFLKLMYVKNEMDVKDVLVHAVTIYNRLWVTGRLAFAREATRNAIWKISMILSGVKDIGTLRTYSFMIFHMLMQRRTELCAATNRLIDEVDQLYDDQAGDRLFSALSEFERYPVNTTKTGYFLCDNLMESVLSPFRHVSVTTRRLLDRVNKALRNKFPHLSKETELKQTISLPAVGNIKNKTVSRIRKKKPRPNKMQDRIKRIQHRLYNIYNNKNSLYIKQYSIDYEKSMLRTRNDFKFRATTFEPVRSTSESVRSTSEPVRSTSKYISDSENGTFDFEKEELSLTEMPFENVQKDVSLNLKDEETIEVNGNESAVTNYQDPIYRELDTSQLYTGVTNV